MMMAPAEGDRTLSRPPQGGPSLHAYPSYQQGYSCPTTRDEDVEGREHLAGASCASPIPQHQHYRPPRFVVAVALLVTGILATLSYAGEKTDASLIAFHNQLLLPTSSHGHHRHNGVLVVAKSKLDPGLTCTVEMCTDMMYSTGADTTMDRPDHLRAASSMQWITDTRMVIMQDDMNFIALVDIELPAFQDASLLSSSLAVPMLRIKDAYSISLPASNSSRQFDKSRGNKHMKLDLEASIYVSKEHSPLTDGFLLGFGSGSSKATTRDVIILVRDSLLQATCDVTVDFQAVNATYWAGYCGDNFDAETASRPSELIAFYAPAFYHSLRKRTDFSGSELNMEGAAFIAPSKATNEPAKVRFFQRGNGASANRVTGQSPKSATGEIVAKELFEYMDSLLVSDGQEPLFYHKHEEMSAPPSLADVVEYMLGSVDGVKLAFTGSAPAFLSADHDFEDTAFVYIAGAEASPDATRDGAVVGTAVGIIHSTDFKSKQKHDVEAGSYNFLTYPNGEKFLLKTEGVIIPPATSRKVFNKEDGVALTVLDMDDPTLASQMCVVWMRHS